MNIYKITWSETVPVKGTIGERGIYQEIYHDEIITAETKEIAKIAVCKAYPHATIHDSVMLCDARL